MKLLFGRLFMPAAAGCQTVEKRAHAHDRHGGGEAGIIPLPFSFPSQELSLLPAGGR